MSADLLQQEVFVDLGRKLATFQEVESKIYDAFNGKAAFSLIRLGDGEGTVLAFPEFVHPTRYARWMYNFFGKSFISLDDLSSLKPLLQKAIYNATIVGLFHKRHSDLALAKARLLSLGALDGSLTQSEKKVLSNLEWSIVFDVAKPFLSKQTLTNTSVHKDLERKGLIKTLIERSSKVNIVTGCDGIKEKMLIKYPSKNFSVYKVPSEFKFRSDQAAPDETHFPIVFDRICESIKRGNFDGLSLVGAGPCGKIYCDAIRANGGFAIDIGSIFDLWASRMTRSFMENMTSVTL